MKKALVFCCLIISATGNAQRTIDAERPGELQSPRVIEKRAFQLEAGYFLQSWYPAKLQRMPEVNFRYGLSGRFELRLNVMNEKQQWGDADDADGFHPLEPGVKIRLAQSRDSSLSASFQGHIGLHFISAPKYDPRLFYHKLRLLLQGQLTKQWDMNINFGTDWDHEEFEQNWIYGLGFDLQAGKRMKTSLEFFGHSTSFTHSNELRGGLGYLLRPNLALDASAGLGLNETSPDFTLGIGLSWRIR